MKRCEKCGVQFSGDLDRCPLCQAELSGDASPAVFPRNEVRKSGAIALAVLAFATGACLLPGPSAETANREVTRLSPNRTSSTAGRM